MQNLRRNIIAASLFLASVSFYTGCSKTREPTYPVHGVVTLQGKTPSGGTILFESVEPGASGKRYGARGKIEPNGQYQLSTFGDNDGAVAGKHRVAVLPEQIILGDPPSPEDKKRADAILQIPPKYQSTDTSNRTYEVKPGENTINVELN
jgi:hypothetical protein